MKKQITILSFLFTSFILAQETNSKFNLGLKYQVGQIGAIGIEAEYFGNKNLKSPLLFNANLTGLSIKTDYGDAVGLGYEVGIGSRNYLNKNSLPKGVYVDSYINYGSITFNDDLSFNNGKFNVDGKFKYISILNSSIGYKFLIKKFIVEPSISGRYNIEIKAKGDIDNKDINNFLFNAGIRLGYTF